MPQTLLGADSTFVGSLATALEPEVSADLGLDDQTREKLEDLATERENQALELALSLKGAPPEERQRKLDAYVAE